MTNRNLLYLGIGALGVAAVVLGYVVYLDRQNAGGVEIQLGGGGVSIERNRHTALSAMPPGVASRGKLGPAPDDASKHGSAHGAANGDQP